MRPGGLIIVHREALALATLSLGTATNEQAAAVTRILRDGAGVIEHEGMTHLSPPGLMPERRAAWLAVAEAIRLDSAGHDDWRDEALWRPTRAGDWESVLATLLVQRDWSVIERTARELEE